MLTGADFLSHGPLTYSRAGEKMEHDREAEAGVTGPRPGWAAEMQRTEEQSGEQFTRVTVFLWETFPLRGRPPPPRARNTSSVIMLMPLFPPLICKQLKDRDKFCSPLYC